MSIDVLGWELFDDNAKKRHDKLPISIDLENRLIFETNNFFAICGLGAFVKGYLVIITKDYLNSFAALDSDLLEEYKWISDVVSEFYREKYNKEISIFEHGMCSCAGGLDHAHMHTMPLQKFDKADLKKIVNRILKNRAAGINKIFFENNEFENVHDISTIINFNSNYKILDGKLLQYDDIEEFNENLEKIKEEVIKKEQYIFFNYNNEIKFTTNYYLGTQFGRELIYEIYFTKNLDKKKYFNSLMRSNPNKLIWRWQDYSFKENILDTILDMRDFLNNYNKIDLNNYGFKLRVK